MVIVNYNVSNNNTSVKLASLKVDNITNLPNAYSYRFQAALSLYQNGTISNSNSGYMRLNQPTVIQVYKNGVYQSNITPANYSGWVQTTKYIIMDNVSPYPDPQEYTAEIWFGGFHYDYIPASTGLYEFYVICDYQFYSDNSYNGSSFNVSIVDYGVKSNPLVATSQLLNCVLKTGTVNESGFLNANCNLNWTPTTAVSSYMFMGPTLYPRDANVANPQLLFQQYLNVAIYDPMQYGSFPYKFRIARWVFIFDNTSYQPSYVKINIMMKKKATPAAISAQGDVVLQNFQFQYNSIIMEPNQIDTTVEHNVPVQFYIVFLDANNNQQVFNAEFIVIPYVYQILD
uniref:Uncharacterized protein n=1 Tax=viral metagenome TaxID=1070528 RepID=A0A6C0JUK5_9ZZZZ